MNFADQLRVLQAAQGDPSKLALATVDLAYPLLSEAERAALRESLEAAAIPHWCDDAILSALLGFPPEESAAHLARLRALRVVESFPARGTRAVNVHEAARLAIRKGMATQVQDRFRKFSAQATSHFAPDLSPSGRIEWIFHLLCGDPERGATELEKLDREWGGSARPEDRSALAAALGELESDGLVQGRARVWTLLSMAWTRVSRAESAQLAPLAEEILRLAQTVGDLGAEADAQCLCGDVLEAQGKLAQARAAFGESLGISRLLVEQDPGNAGWQRELAATHSKVGDVLQAQGNLAEAQAAFGEDLRISRRLAEQDPDNAGWQRDLAVAHSKMGGVLEAQGNLAEAQAAFGEYLRISRRLAEQDPSKAGWQRDLAVACWWIANMNSKAGKHSEALPRYEEAARIFGHLAERAPGFAQWARDKQRVEQELALCRLRAAAQP
jgi:tetratricopeptide (TPR) repeat protein